MDMEYNNFHLMAHLGDESPLFRDDMGNVWAKRVSIKYSGVFIVLGLYRRHDGTNGPIVIRHNSRSILMKPGNHALIKNLQDSDVLQLCQLPKQEHEILDDLKARPEKVKLISKDGTQFDVSKPLLIVKEYFKILLEGNFKEAGEDEIKMDDLPSSTVSAFVEYLEKDTINCNLGDLVRLGHMAQRWMMPRLIERVELEILACFDKPETEEVWQEAYELGALLKSTSIAFAFAHRDPPDT